MGKLWIKLLFFICRMGNVSEKVEAAASTSQIQNTEAPKKLKPCCACPETKKARDAWWVNYIIKC